MSFCNRLKEQREHIKMTRAELADILGVTQAAIGNYENGISTPKADILFKVFDALKCDANYLFQDEMKSQSSDAFSLPEIQIIKNYRELDKHGKEMVDFVLEKESARCESERKAAESAYLVLSAAHEIPGSSEEDSCFDDEIMQDENF